ncbi:DapH/DapD/GlmU-related protein [Lactococcus sp.]|uniref:acyltransferase n=1 Tax=Lactococcus sp. TaxID=44273 RepID=UPI0035B3DF4D
MKVGEGCRIFNDLGVAEPYLVTIGDNVTMSGNVQFITHDGSIVKLGLENATHTLGSIKVGNDCFIGHGAIIMPGVKIGNRSIIGAGAVVTKSVPDGAVACGNPARVISGIEEMAAKLRGKTFDLLSLAPSERKAYVMAHPELLKENWKN